MIIAMAAMASAVDMDIPDIPDTGYRPGLSDKELRLSPGGMAAATSFLPDAKSAARYAPDAAFDGVPATAWVEGKADDGIGEKIGFARFQRVSGIRILAGLGAKAYFKKNNRVKSAALSIFEVREETATQDGMVYSLGKLAKRINLQFRDEMSKQEFSVGVTSKTGKGYLCVLEIKEVYRGTSCRDTCISEIEVIE